MARQPFYPQHAGKRHSIGLDHVKNNPRLAALIGVCANSWSHVELHLSLTLGSMLGVENAASVAVFGALRNARAQRDALQAAADSTLDGEMLDIFNALMAVHRALDSQRNDVVHGMWGESADLPGTALWESMQSHANFILSVYHAEAARRPHPRNTGEGCAVYNLDDIERLNADIDALHLAIMSFHVVLRYRHLLPVVAENALLSLRSNALLRME